MKIKLLVSIVSVFVSFAIAEPVASPTLHAFCFLDTAAENIGESCRNDGKALMELFENSFPNRQADGTRTLDFWEPNSGGGKQR